MKEAVKNTDRFYLFPSNLFAVKNGTQVTTILGSCVAVCLYDPINKKGGINHYMLPLWNGQGLASPKYGNIAIERLIEKMAGIDAKKENLVAKVFGGANQTNSSMQIGYRNIQVALDLLKKHKIKVVGKSVGGEVGRKIVFNTNSGEVRMKYVGTDK